MTEFRVMNSEVSPETEPINYNPLPRGDIHGKAKGTGVDSFGVEGRENESGKPTEARRRGSISAGQVGRRKFLYKTEADSLGSGAEEDESGAEGTMGENIVDRSRRRGT